MPKQWNTPGGDALNLYTDILKQPHTLRIINELAEYILQKEANR